MSVLPGLVISKHCAQLSHDGGDDDLEGLSVAGQPFGKTAEDGMRPDCGQNGHVEAFADLAASAKDPSFSALLAAIAIVRGSPAMGWRAALAALWLFLGYKLSPKSARNFATSFSCQSDTGLSNP